MGIVKASSKLAARMANDSIANRQMNNAHKTAYKMTGDELRKATKQGRHINAKRAYQRNLEQTKRKIEQGHKNRGKFIDEL